MKIHTFWLAVKIMAKNEFLDMEIYIFSKKIKIYPVSGKLM